MSPEERAKAVVTEYMTTDQLLGPDGQTPIMDALIATAIRQAERDALERAVGIAEAEGRRASDEAGLDTDRWLERTRVATSIASQIRSWLNAKDPT